MSRKSDLLNNIGEKLSNININIENIDLNALVELKEELLNTSDERHQSYTIHSMIDIFMITFLLFYLIAMNGCKSKCLQKNIMIGLKNFYL